MEVELEQARDTTQDQLGNQEVAAMLGIPSMAPGSAGLGIEGDDRDFELGVEFGGDDDDDLVADGPQTLADLTREWNKGTQRGRDTTSFVEPMPGESLPPEDGVLAARIRADPDHPDLPVSDSLDPMLQPSEPVIAGDIGSWLREALRWTGGELPHRTLAHAILPVAPPLLDPYGRVFLARSRAAAIATLLMRDGPVLRRSPTPTLSAFVDVCLELAGQKHTVLDVWWRAQQAQLELPVGAEVLAGELQGRRGGPGPSVELPPRAHEHIVEVMEDLVDLPSAATLVPFVPELAPSDHDDEADPLGLDAVLEQFTGGKADPVESLYATVIHGAERLASAVARSRVRFAGLGRAVCEVGDQWITGAPSMGSRIGDSRPLRSLPAPAESWQEPLAGAMRSPPAPPQPLAGALRHPVRVPRPVPRARRQAGRPSSPAAAPTPLSYGGPRAERRSPSKMRTVAGAHGTARSTIRPQHRGHRQPTSPKTCHSSHAHVRYRVRPRFGDADSASVSGSASSSGASGTTSRRHAERPANTPWCARGGGTSDASRSTSSSAVNVSATVPSDHGRFSSRRTRPSSSSITRRDDTAGRAT